MKIIDERQKQEKKQLTFADLKVTDCFAIDSDNDIRQKLDDNTYCKFIEESGKIIVLRVNPYTTVQNTTPVIKLDATLTIHGEA